MKKFIATVFEFHTGPRVGLASIWLTVTDNDLRRTRIPIELEEEFQQIGPLPFEMANQVTVVLKSIFKELDVEYIELATSDD